MRRPILAANWKMNLGRTDEALDFVRRIRFPLSEIEAADRILCPPFTVLAAVAEALSPTSIAVGAQNMHFEEQGAHTGEVSAAMLTGLCRFVILGHSERRAAGGALETDPAINRKARAALARDLTPIVCVGENLEQMEAGETQAWVSGQVTGAFDGLSAAQVARCVIAYEPIWAIGTGRAATPADANRVIAFSIRGPIADRFGEAVAQAVRVQYGGSVTVDNIAEFMAMPEIDGALVGGASLKPDYVDLVRRAAEAAGSR
ncbi:MAG: triose-phosphate isomerase [Anaerolineales bacterium]|nr:triose-phosphate isomerase [Anaerolineales bacterium]